MIFLFIILLLRILSFTQLILSFFKYVLYYIELMIKISFIRQHFMQVCVFT